MYVLFLAGGIASGKSTVAKMLEDKGFMRVDLDSISREVLEADSPCVCELQEAFGDDIVDVFSGEVNRKLLAQRAFGDSDSALKLEDIELPYIKKRLVDILTEECCVATFPKFCVVEIPLLDRVEDLFDLADSIACVSCDTDLRQQRAIERGMSADDFEARDSKQPSQQYLISHCNFMFINDKDKKNLQKQVDFWFDTVQASD